MALQQFSHLSDIFFAWQTALTAIGPPGLSVAFGKRARTLQVAPPYIVALPVRGTYAAGAIKNIGATDDGSRVPTSPVSGRALYTRSMIIEFDLWGGPTGTDTDGYDQCEDLAQLVIQVLDASARGSYRVIGDVWPDVGVSALGVRCVLSISLDRPMIAAADVTTTILQIKVTPTLARADGSAYATPPVTLPVANP